MSTLQNDFDAVSELITEISKNIPSYAEKKEVPVSVVRQILSSQRELKRKLRALISQEKMQLRKEKQNEREASANARRKERRETLEFNKSVRKTDQLINETDAVICQIRNLRF